MPNSRIHTSTFASPSEESATALQVAPPASDAPSAPVSWSGFHRRSIEERRAHLREALPQAVAPRVVSSDLPESVADAMIENCIGTLSLPLGLGLNLDVNGRTYAVPMAVEEPSIIAAVSGAAKLIAAHGGFRCRSTSNVMIAQVQLVEVPDPQAAQVALSGARQRIIAAANELCPNMVKRGGGVVDVEVRSLPPRPGHDDAPMLVVHLHVDVCEAMGANVANTIAEGVAPLLAELAQARAGLRILSNLSTQRRAHARFEVPVGALAWKGFEGPAVARQLLEAYEFAERDPYRAATHNKGILNGIDAVALATGQDWRAIEAGAHAWAARNGSYRSMTHYGLSDDGDRFWGELELPLALGTKGGALQSHPSYRYTLALLGQPSARELGQVMVAVGLAQNLAAMRALATEGIQAGHMGLHARNLAIAAGVPTKLVAEAVAFMRANQCVSRDGAREFLARTQTSGGRA